MFAFLIYFYIKCSFSDAWCTWTFFLVALHCISVFLKRKILNCMQKVFIYMRYRESIYQKSENEQFTVIYLYARNKNIYFTNCPRMKNGQRTKKSGTRSSNSNNKKKEWNNTSKVEWHHVVKICYFLHFFPYILLSTFNCYSDASTLFSSCISTKSCLHAHTFCLKLNFFC